MRQRVWLGCRRRFVDLLRSRAQADLTGKRRSSPTPFCGQETRWGTGTESLLRHDPPSGDAGHETRIRIPSTPSRSNFPSMKYSVALHLHQLLPAREGGSPLTHDHPSSTIHRFPWPGLLPSYFNSSMCPHPPSQEYHSPSGPHSWAPMLTHIHT